MLIAIVLSLVAEHDMTLPAFVGRAGYAAALGALSRVDAELAGRIHDNDGAKPLTCSSLLGTQSRGGKIDVRAGEEVALRVTGLTPEVSRALAAALLESPPDLWELDGHRLRVARTICNSEQHGWSGQTTYEGLAAAQLTQAERLDRQVTLEFASPTSFKSKEMNIPIPLPGLVFGSLVERWNTFSPVVLSPEMRRFGEEVMAISRYRLVSQTVESKAGGLRVGGMGTVTYRALGGDRYWLGVMHMLASFAFYSGVGVQTATGMGQARCVEK